MCIDRAKICKLTVWYFHIYATMLFCRCGNSLVLKIEFTKLLSVRLCQDNRRLRAVFRFHKHLCEHARNNANVQGVRATIACSRLSDSKEHALWKARENMSVWSGKRGQWRKNVSSRFIFAFVLSQSRGPDYLAAWNRLQRRKREQRVIQAKRSF